MTLTNPLMDAGILQQVIKFLPGSYLFLSAVCREWKAVYIGIGEWQVHNFGLHFAYHRFRPIRVRCGATATLCSAAVSSPATAKNVTGAYAHAPRMRAFNWLLDCTLTLTP
jgi:hypothetical protein